MVAGAQPGSARSKAILRARMVAPRSVALRAGPGGELRVAVHAVLRAGRGVVEAVHEPFRPLARVARHAEADILGEHVRVGKRERARGSRTRGGPWQKTQR